MTGVSILTSKEIYNTIFPEWCISIGFMLMVVFSIMALYFGGEHKAKAIICLVLVFCSCFMIAMGGTSNKNSIKYIEYKVTIDDSVSMTEFMDKYEILDQEGKIYTVKEK